MPESQCYYNKCPCLPQLWSTISQEWTMANNVKSVGVQLPLPACCDPGGCKSSTHTRPEEEQTRFHIRHYWDQQVHSFIEGFWNTIGGQNTTPNSHHEDSGV
jgi:hypothetical protein